MGRVLDRGPGQGRECGEGLYWRGGDRVDVTPTDEVVLPLPGPYNVFRE